MRIVQWAEIKMKADTQTLNSNTDPLFVLMPIKGIHQFSGVFNHRKHDLFY